MTNGIDSTDLSAIESNGTDQGTAYRAPISDIMLALDVAGLDDLLRLGTFRHVDRASVQFALEEFSKIASNEIAPSDRVADPGSHRSPVAVGKL